MKIEVENLVNYTAKRILDNFIQNGIKIDLEERFFAERIFVDMPMNETKKIITDNIDDFNNLLNVSIFNRLSYFLDEGIALIDNGQIRMRTSEEIEEFINQEDHEDYF
jgi:hypothetical protein